MAVKLISISDKRASKSYALIYFDGNKKPIKKRYDTCMKAFYDYENEGCIKVELFDGRGIKLCSYTKSIVTK